MYEQEVQSVVNYLRKRTCWLAAIALLLLAAAFVVRWLDSEPRHQGRPLSAWLDDPTLTEPEIRGAVRAIGTNAIPSLQRWLVEHPSWLERSLRWVDLKQPYFIFNHAPSAAANQRAMRGFLFLGELAEPAVPWLATGADRRDADFEFYLKALAVSGPTGLAALDQIDARATASERLIVVNVLMSGTPRSSERIARLLKRLTDPDVKVRQQVIWALSYWQGSPPPPEIIAALRECARADPDEKTRLLAEGVAGELTRHQIADEQAASDATNGAADNRLP